MSEGQIRKNSARSYFLECPVLFCNRTSKNLGILVPRTSQHLENFFTPALNPGCKNKICTVFVEQIIECLCMKIGL